MIKLLNKELKLSVPILTWIFLSASIITLFPGYPILVSAFFICFGIFNSFQIGRETNDTLYTTLLPIKKSDFVISKYLITCFFQIIGFAFSAIFTAIRMTILADAVVYIYNPLMNATPFYLAFVLLIYSAFNIFFLGGFFKTAYNIGIPFLIFGIVSFLIICVGEAAHYIPALSFLNTTYGERLDLQFLILIVAIIIYIISTIVSCIISMKKFENIDL